MLNLLSLERMMKKEKCYWEFEKLSNWFLKQEKAVNTKACRKKMAKIKEKEKEKASRKSQNLLKPKGKSKKPIALKTKRQG